MANAIQRAAQAVVRGLFGVTWGGPGVGTWQYAQDWIRGSDLVRQPDALDKPFCQVGPLQRVISVIARDAAKIPWEFFRVDSRGNPSDEPVEGHPVSAVWSNPNQLMNGNQLMVGSYISYYVFGEWIWYYPDLQIGRDGFTRRSTGGGIELLNPLSIRRKIEDDGELHYYQWDERSGEEVELDSSRLTRSYRYNPYAPLMGLPLAVAIAHELLGYHSAAAWNARFFNEQNGVPTLVLIPSVTSGMMTSDKREDFDRRWSSRTGRRRGFARLPAGWDIKDFGSSQRDMDFNGLQQFGRDEILAAAGVPPLIAGYLTRSVTYNASEQKDVYWFSTIDSFVEEQQDVINSDFLPKVGVAERVYPNWDQVKAALENLTEKTEVANKWFLMGLSKKVINERLEMGWDPDDVEDYEEAYLPFTIAPVGQLQEERSPAGPVGDDDEGEDDEEVERGFPVSSARESRRGLVWRRVIEGTRALERSMHRVYRSEYNRVKVEVLGNLEGVKGWRLRHEKAVDSTAFFDVDEAKRRLVKRASPISRSAIKKGGEAVIFETGLEIAFNLSDPRVLALIAENQVRLAGPLDTLADEVRRVIAAGVDESLTLDQMRDRLTAQFDISMGRARVIARTETGVGYNGGRHQGMAQAGIDRQEWLSSRDPDVRDEHVAVDGEKIAIGETFSNGLRYPNDPGGPAHQVINCRCVAVPVVG